jgi:cardiolipin synthase
MNVPNILTTFRIVLVPLLGYMMQLGEYVPAAIIFIAAVFTDFLDGFLARKFNQVTNFGKVMDPVADKLLVLMALYMLTIQKKIPLVIFIIVVAKEILLGIGGLLLYRNKKRISSADWYGKIASGIFYFAILMLILDVKYSKTFMVIAVAATVFALAKYIAKYLKLMGDPAGKS